MNTSVPHINNIDNLKEWFQLVGATTWNLHAGFMQTIKQTYIFKQEDESLDNESSWEVLKRQLDIQRVGKFTINVKAYKGNHTAKVFYMQTSNSLYPGMPSVAGYHQQSYAPALGYVSPDEVQRRIDQAITTERLKREIEDLQAARDAKSDWQDILMEKVLQIDPDQALAKIGGFISGMMQPGQQVQLRGVTEDQSPTGEVKETGYTYNSDRLIIVLDTLRKHFDDDESFMKALESFSVKFDQSPDTFKNFL